MKTRSRFLARIISAMTLVVAAAAIPAVAADAPFAGRVDMTMTQIAKKTTSTTAMTYYMRDTKVRIEVTPPANAKTKDKDEQAALSAVTLVDTEKNEMIIFMPAQKMYFSLNMGDAKDVPASVSQRKVNFTPTGRTEVIAGITAEEYVSDPDPKTKEISEIWITPELGKFVMANQNAKPSLGKNAKAPEKNAWQKFLDEKGAFLMRIVQRPKTGAAENYRLEVTNVERMTPDDSLFAIPEDYKKFEMPKIGDLFKGLTK